MSNTCTILFVDDEINILQSLKRLFHREPYTILTASSARQGLEILEKTDVDICLSDNRMPGMTGNEFMARVKKQFPAVIRIALTGYTDVDSITDCINKGHVYKFVLKPWDDDELKETIRHAVEELRLEKEKREIQNHALKSSQKILEHLCVGVIELDADNLVIFMNKLARNLFEQNGRSLLTSDVRGFLAGKIVELIERVSETMICKETAYNHKGERPFLVGCTPLQHALKDRGILLTFTGLRKGGDR